MQFFCYLQIPNKLGDPQGIKFIFKNYNNFTAQLTIRNEHQKALQIFGRVLERKYIVQLGFHSSFKPIKKIGKGMTACVFNALNFADGKQVALKSFRRSVYFEQENGKASFLNEFKILTEVNHKNLCQLLSVYQSDNSTYIILELYPLSLYGYLQKYGFPSLQNAKILLINLLQGISALHTKGIMHRDLKLENIMVKKQSSGRVIPVVVDFGLSEYTKNTKYLFTRCGTPGYIAPQVLKMRSTDAIQTYTQACDTFSLGVIFHMLLFKKPVFQGTDMKQVVKKNAQCEIDFNSDRFKSLSSQGRHLLEQMLCKDPTKRITVQNALNHPFLVDERKNYKSNCRMLIKQNIRYTPDSINDISNAPIIYLWKLEQYYSQTTNYRIIYHFHPFVQFLNVPVRLLIQFICKLWKDGSSSFICWAFQ